MSTLQEALRLDDAYHVGMYARKPVLFVRGEGARLFDDAGREYLDCVSGIGAVNLGHAHPAVAEAVARQVTRLVHVSNLYYVEHRAELAETLVALAGGGRKAFFTNSGAESTEGAIKLARRWGVRRRGPSCVNVVTAERSFHGRTLAALAATGQPAKQEAFAPLPAGFSHVPLNDIGALEAAVDADTCAVMLEPIQGEGGVRPCDPEYLAAVRRLCDERDVLLVLDEVQTGFFRTGPCFAFQGYDGVVPDILTLAKSLANGLPIGAVVATDEVAGSFAPGDHGSTFAGGPVVCAAARATIEALHAEELGMRTRLAGARLATGLRDMAATGAGISEVRGTGLMVAAELSRPVAAQVASSALAEGLVLNSIGDSVIRFLPPLVCSDAEIDTILGTLDAVLREV